MTSVALQIEGGEQQTLREALHEARFAQQGAEAKLIASQRALSRGEELVAGAQAELQQHDGAVKLVAAAEAQRIADEAAGRPAALPDDGAEGRARARQTLESRLADATRARAILQAEADKAKRDLAAASWHVDSAIGALLCEAGDQIATELLASETIARDLRLQLTGLAEQWIPHGGQPAPVRLGGRAVRALNDLPLNDDRRPKQGPAHISPSARFARDWQLTIAALRVDPEAPLPEIKPR